MRGQREKDCLDTIKNTIFCDQNGNFIRNLKGKNFLEVSEQEFLQDYLFYTNIQYECLFGLTEEDGKEIVNVLRKVIPNDKASEFPDFIFDNGFIEHFQITSSKENKKGAKQIINEKNFERKTEQTQKQFIKECEETPSFDKVRSCTSSMQNPEHSYEYLCKSIKTNFTHHLKSLENYNGNKEVGIFLIENPEFALSMLENIFEDYPNGISHGDLREQQTFMCYRLSRDKKMLNYLYTFKDRIKYIFYCYTDYERSKEQTGIASLYCNAIKKYEIIKLDSIPYLLKLLPWDFATSPLFVNRVSSVYNISSKIQTDDTKNNK